MKLDLSVELCKHFEGYRAKPYLCPAGVPTIGYGSTYYANGVRVAINDAVMSEVEASELLLFELQHTYLPAVLRHCPILFGHPNKCNAIVDWTYNLGVGRLQSSTLKRKINAQDWDEVKIQIARWTRGGGKVLPGLVKRRSAEISLFQ